MSEQTPPALLRRSGPIPSLDGIRALAVGLVFLAHSGLEHVVPGGLGVTVFFVLSGFLITTLMRVEHARLGRIDFRGFYLRRILRLGPPLLIVVVLSAALSAAGVLAGGFSLGGLLAVLFYLGNYHVIVQDFAGLPAGLGVVWSLAVEEHYYLFYPPLAALLLSLGRRGYSAATLGALCLLVLAWRVWLFNQGVSEAYIGMATDTRIDAILVGCLLALLRNPWLDAAPAAPPSARRDGLLLAGCLLALLGSLLYREPWFRDTLRYTVQSLAIAPLLYLAVARAEHRPFRWLNARPLAYLGGVSYSVYLSHHLIFFALREHRPDLGWGGLAIAGTAVTLLFAEAMRRWVEQPCARLRKRLHARRSPAAGTASAAPVPPAGPAGLRVSVCIATYQRSQRLDLLLADLTQQRLRPSEIVIVDNDGAGSAMAVARSWQQRCDIPIIYEIQPVKNIALTRNRSVELASGEWLAFVDDDERAPAGWLAQLMASALTHGADGVLGPVEPVVPADAPAWIRKGRFYDWVRLRSGSTIPPNQLRFGNLVLRGALLRATSPLFDPAYGLTGGEDGDLLTRLQGGGARLVWCDEAIVHEPVEAARLSVRWLLRRALRGGQDYARHTLTGRYGEVNRGVRTRLFVRALTQASIAAVLCLLFWPLSRHRGVHWATKVSANLGKLSVFWGQHYREYA